MDLRITQTYAKIGIDRTPSSLEIEMRKARLEFRQKHAKVNIHTELPRVEIDQYECFASAGLKNDLDRAKEIAQRTYQQVLEFIGKTAEDGKSLASIEKGGNPIVEIAQRDAWPTHEFGLDFIPKAAPKITVTGELRYDPERNSEGVNNGIEGDFIPGSLSINFMPAIVNVYVAQKNSINIEYVGGNVDTYM
jgi:hypothetical protein